MPPLCGYCKKGFDSIRGLLQHWRAKKCPQWRFVWEKVLESRRRGHSGRRILARAFPHLYPSKPMSEATRERLDLHKKTKRRLRGNRH